MNKFDEFGDKYLVLKRTPKGDAFWFRISRSADHSIIWFLLALIRYIFIGNLSELIFFIVIIGLESAITNGPIKYCFRRQRPHEKEKTYNKSEPLPYGLRLPITSSFPSGHATAAMCSAVLLSMGHPWIGLFVFPLGLLIAYSRMYTRMHHLSDILGGLILGLLFGYISLFIYNSLM